MLKLFSKDLLRYLPGQVVPALLVFISLPVLTYVLSAEEFGQYILVLTSVGILVTLFSWLGTAMVRFYPAVPEQEVAVLLRTSYWTQLVSSVVLATVVLILARILWVDDAAFQQLVTIGVLIFVVQSLFNLLTHVLRARLEGGRYSLFTVLARMAGLGLGILFAASMDLGVTGFLWGIVLGILICLPFLWRRVFEGVRVRGRVSPVLLRQMSSYGIPLLVGSLGVWVLSQADRYLIGVFYGAKEVGLYSAAYWVSENSINLIGGLFMLSSGPLLASVWEKEGQEATKRLLSSVTRLHLLVSIPAVAGLSFLAEPIMKVLTGSGFSNAHTIVPWVAVGAFFLGLQHRFNQVLQMLKRTQEVMLWLIVSALLNVGLNWLLLPLVGYEIAAVNTLICYLFLCLTMATASRRHLRWEFPWLAALRSLLSAGVMLSGLFFLVNTVNMSPLWTLCTAIPVGMLVYGLSIWVLGEISSAECKAVGISLRRRFAQRFTPLSSSS